MSSFSLIDLARITYELEREFDASFDPGYSVSWGGLEYGQAEAQIKRVVQFLSDPQPTVQLDFDPSITAKQQLFAHTVLTLAPLLPQMD